MPLTMTGERALVQWGYQCAAVVEAWTIARQEGTGAWRLMGRVSEADPYAITQPGLRLVVRHQSGAWGWPIESVNMKTWFVSPDTVRLTLEDGPEWIDVKNRLTHGEREGMLSAMSPFVTPGEPIQLARKEIRTGLVNAYLVGWSLTRGGLPVAMSPDLPDNVRLATLRSLSAEAFDLIHAAIDAHSDRIKQADADEKKVPPVALAS
jgi:hypothetical protein